MPDDQMTKEGNLKAVGGASGRPQHPRAVAKRAMIARAPNGQFRINEKSIGKRINLNIESELAYVANKRINRYLRAVRFHQPFVAIHFATSARKTVQAKLRGKLIVRLPIKLSRAARLFAAMKLLENLTRISSMLSKRQAHNKRIVKLINKDFFHVYAIFAGDDDWRNARYLPDPAQFQAAIDDAATRIRNVSALLDFSLRTEPEHLSPRQTGGVTSALDLLGADGLIKHFTGREVSKATLIRHWQRHKTLSIRGYLFYYQGYLNYPLCLTKTGFANNLLKTVDDAPFLLKIISTYEEVRARLKTRGYNLGVIKVPLKAPLPPPEIRVEHLPPAFTRLSRP
jgi:hypothetical protein